MTKRFALADTLPTPYFSIDAGAGAAVTVRTSEKGDGRVMVEIWRDGTILCRVFAASVQMAEELSMQETTGQKIRKAGSTYLGSAKPDDPVYSEGWTITPGLFGRQSKTPSSSTPEVKPDGQDQQDRRVDQGTEPVSRERGGE